MCVVTIWLGCAYKHYKYYIVYNPQEFRGIFTLFFTVIIVLWGNWESKEFHLFCKDICWATSKNVKVSVYMWFNYLLLFSTTTVYVWLHCIKVESAICKKISSWRSKPCHWNRSGINPHLEIPMVTKKHKTMPLVWSCFSLGFVELKRPHRVAW